MKIVDASFHCHNKNFIHQNFDGYIFFTGNTLPKSVSLTWNFQNSFHELFLTLSLSVRICIYEFYELNKAF